MKKQSITVPIPNNAIFDKPYLNLNQLLDLYQKKNPYREFGRRPENALASGSPYIEALEIDQTPIAKAGSLWEEELRRAGALD